MLSSSKNRSKSTARLSGNKQTASKQLGNTYANTRSRNQNESGTKNNELRGMRQEVQEFRLSQEEKRIKIEEFQQKRSKQRVEGKKYQELNEQLNRVYEINQKYAMLLNSMVHNGFKALVEKENLSRDASSQYNAALKNRQQKDNVQESKRETILRQKINLASAENMLLKRQLQEKNNIRLECLKLRNFLLLKESQAKESSVPNLVEKSSSKWAKEYIELFSIFESREQQLMQLKSQVTRYHQLQKQLQQYQQYEQRRQSSSPNRLKELGKSLYSILQKLERKVEKQKKKEIEVSEQNSRMIGELEKLQKNVKKAENLRNNLQIKFLDLSREHQYCKSRGKKYRKIEQQKQRQNIKGEEKMRAEKKIGKKISDRQK